jgi:uncharacterized membrane protein YgcG
VTLFISANIKSNPLMSHADAAADINEVGSVLDARTGVIGWQEIAPDYYQADLRRQGPRLVTYWPGGYANAVPISWSKNYHRHAAGATQTHGGIAHKSPARFVVWVALRDDGGHQFWHINTHFISEAYSDDPSRQHWWQTHRQVLINTVKRMQDRYGPHGTITGDFNRYRYEDPQLIDLGAHYHWPASDAAGISRGYDYLISFGGWGDPSDVTRMGLHSDHDGVRINLSLNAKATIPGPPTPGNYPPQPRIPKGVPGLAAGGIASVNQLEHLIVRGRRVTSGTLGEAILSASAAVSTTQISDISVTFHDPDFELLKSGLFEKHGVVDFLGFRQQIYTVTTGAAADNRGQVTIQCRAAAAVKLQNRQGTRVLRNASPTDFVVSECHKAGVKVRAQRSANRKIISRDTGNGESSWTTMERLAREVGFLLFESAGTVYFGKPSWLAARDTQVLRVTYNSGYDTDTIGVPAFSDTIGQHGISVQFDVERERLHDFMPGQRLRIMFAPYDKQIFLVTGLSFPIARDGVATVTAAKPVDPKPAGEQQTPDVGGGGGNTGGGGSGGGGGGSGSGGGGGGGGGGGNAHTALLGDLLYGAGFRGHALDVACGIAIAESGGFHGGRWHVNAHALGDIALADAKWGPSVGCFQIRSLRHPGNYSGLDRRRTQSKLMHAEYNAHTAFLFSGGGAHWGAWSTWNNGRYHAGVGKTHALVHGWTGHSGGPAGGHGGANPPPHGGGGSGPTGRKSAHDFVAIALKQAGDRYVWGAEASPNDPNPERFDCSELVQWAAARVGCYMPDGSSNQKAWMARKGTLIGPDKGLATRGAILWIPGHVAISLGGHKGTIEATNPTYGVRTWGPHRSFRWVSGGKIPGMRYG